MKEFFAAIAVLAVGILILVFWETVKGWVLLALFLVVIFPEITIPLFFLFKPPCSYGRLPPRR